MELQPLDYIVNKNMGEETITITKKALEKWRNHYNKVADTQKKKAFYFGFYKGKAEVLIDLLKHFEE